MNIEQLAAASGYGMTTTKPNALETGAKNFLATFDKADQAAQGFSTGTIDAQSVVEALSQAELALQTAISVRDQVVSAYQDILRMPL
ncbi:flagellar hook-basal body protein FliE [Parvularcula sp. ZS-1/3]|uniref:Flagellar hook-basal body protein FliE n=1 Tax=Parvularcula mediterranea TaxID=2732508 RepID=A0A7Y3RKT2_9PROT|nr:flagellar hook-basal body complex protein FliE [Parvularcula mediterranea]NNU15371.1 flagellar hook-basal body protein FliE [Parvularcula mediterranea]